MLFIRFGNKKYVFFFVELKFCFLLFLNDIFGVVFMEVLIWYELGVGVFLKYWGFNMLDLELVVKNDCGFRLLWFNVFFKLRCGILKWLLILFKFIIDLVKYLFMVSDNCYEKFYW